MEYGSYSDEELRRVLNADDRDTDAIIEAAERFRKQENEEDRGAVKHEFDMAVECPECNHCWDEYVDVLDYLPGIL